MEYRVTSKIMSVKLPKVPNIFNDPKVPIGNFIHVPKWRHCWTTISVSQFNIDKKVGKCYSLLCSIIFDIRVKIYIATTDIDPL